VVLAFLVYLIGISLDKACAVLGFFCQLPLSKSQADALLRQLANHWEEEYNTLCALIAHAAIVYMDETGWKVGNEKCSLWAFASQLHRVFLFGCHKDDATLDAMLPPDIFDGIGVSDDAGVYQNRMTARLRLGRREGDESAFVYDRRGRSVDGGRQSGRQPDRG
jgi:transposase